MSFFFPRFIDPPVFFCRLGGIAAQTFVLERFPQEVFSRGFLKRFSQEVSARGFLKRFSQEVFSRG